MSETVKGFKVFNSKWFCMGKKYTCPGRFKEEGIELELCECGMHFCLTAADCFHYYDFDSNNHVAEVIAHGKVIYGEDKCCTDDLEIVREIPWDEVLRLVNTGKNCTGFLNTGDCNTGNWNTGNVNTGDKNIGDCNTGDRNIGDGNTGNCNTGDFNIGNCNTGDRNIGDCNTGDGNIGDGNTGNKNTGDCNIGNCNTGDCNIGDWNKSSYNTGCFMTEEPKIYLFNKPSDWSYHDWLDSKARSLLNQIPKNVVKWIGFNDMTDEERTAFPAHEFIMGYLKVLDESECNQIWWDGLNEEQKEVIRNIPNYDKEIFEQITGIKTEFLTEGSREGG